MDTIGKPRRHWIPLFLLVPALLGLAASGPAAGETYALEGIPVQAPSDTLRYTAPAGRVFITALPDTLGGRAVAAYALLQAPALSWLVDRSFFWRTRPEDAGRTLLLFEARHAAPPADTLAILVTLE